MTVIFYERFLSSSLWLRGAKSMMELSNCYEVCIVSVEFIHTSWLICEKFGVSMCRRSAAILFNAVLSSTTYKSCQSLNHSTQILNQINHIFLHKEDFSDKTYITILHFWSLFVWEEGERERERETGQTYYITEQQYDMIEREREGGRNQITVYELIIKEHYHTVSILGESFEGQQWVIGLDDYVGHFIQVWKDWVRLY